MAGRRSYRESEIQTSIVVFYRRTYAGKIHHAANGGRRAAVEAIRFKREGVEAGHPDLSIYCQGRAYFMEVKRPGGTYSYRQIAYIRDLRADGFDVAEVESLEEAKAAFEAWGLPPKRARVRSNAELATGF
ncbi:MAG TPA: VRR-NUC domain-containing protein [Microvirga sp.]|jgi:hypothetical protein|nr:VRR-NUC domain-containing protein [Microvirga sp.]